MNEIIKDDTNSEAIEKLNKIKLDDSWLNLVVIGNVGVGKTYLTTKLLPHDLFISEGRFKTELTTGNLRLARPNERQSKDSFLLENMIKKNTIIYDDYGTCEITPVYVERMMFRLDERYRNKKRTIFTSNLSKEAFEKREIRISSRILQDAVILIMDGEDRRKKNIRIL